MASPDRHSFPAANGAVCFTTTHWSVVLAAREEDSPRADDALAQLCHIYWYPLYAYVRRRGHDPHDAQDLTQAFFERLLERKLLATVRREHGKFRSFLLTCLGNFLANEWRDGHTLKRGGAVTFIPFDPVLGEERFVSDAARDGSPEMIYDRAWARTVLDQAVDRLERESSEAGKSSLFATLKPFLIAPTPDGGYDLVAHDLGMTSHAVSMAVVRLRQRFREIVRDAVAQTAATPLELDEEMIYFRQLLSQ